MTHLATETSIELGSPIELYDFRYFDTEWNYTSSDTEFYDSVTDKTYAPVALSRANLEFSSDFSRGALPLVMQYDTPFLDLFRAEPPSGVVSLTVRRVHRLDGDVEIITMWKGRVLNINWAGSEAQLTCQSIRSGFQRFALRRQFQFNCSHVLYGPGCNVDKTLFELNGTVTAASGATISISGVSAFAAGYFAGGYVEYSNSELITPERRMIKSNPGGSNALILVSPPLNLLVGSTAIAYPGCDHSLTICDSKFDNSVNYGGFPHTPPNKGPFGGETVY